MGLGRLLPQERAVNSVPWTQKFDNGTDLFSGSRTWAGKDVDYTSASQLLAVYGAVRFITLHVSTMPIDVYVEAPDESRRPAPVPPWLAGPDRSTLLGQMLWSYLMSGDTVAVLAKSPQGVTAVVPVHPDAYEIGYDAAGNVGMTLNGRPFTGEILHIPDVVMPGQVRGINPIEAARQSIGMGLAAMEFGAKFFGQGTVMSGVLQFPGPRPENDELKTIRDNWVRVHGGSANSHMPAVLFGGAEWKPISITPEQAQFLETRRFTAAEIASQLFLLPPSVLGIKAEAGSDMTYQNVGTQWDDVLRRLMPIISKFEQHLSALLPAGVELRFNMDAYLRPETKTRYEAHEIALRAGFLKVDEVRKIEDLPPLAETSGGDLATPREIAELIQKVYLGVDVVLSADEARAIANRAGAGLSGSFKPAPAPPSATPAP